MYQRFNITIRTFLLLVFVALGVAVSAQREYPATLFGIRSNGTTLNTTSIRSALGYIGEQGGGTLVFEVGRYLTGTLHLRDNVNIELREGAVLVGSDNPYDYWYSTDTIFVSRALLMGSMVKNVRIFGKGVIEMPGESSDNNFQTLSHNGLMGLPAPNLIVFELTTSQNVQIDGIFCKNGKHSVADIRFANQVKISNLAIDRLENSQYEFRQYECNDCEVTGLRYWPEKR
ncbi:MAG: hypothetical protein MJZ49_00840 [Bacteroidales bacterium]|nr:hypothetical protein [Bacteroidales bacterium]